MSTQPILNDEIQLRHRVEKRICQGCGSEILEVTFTQNDGFCVPCKKYGARGQAIRRAKLEQQKSRIDTANPAPARRVILPADISRINEKFDPQSAENRGVARCLGPARQQIAALPNGTNPPGVHPDVLNWLEKDLGSELQRPSACLLFGKPALVDPETGIVLAVGVGTFYCLRVPEDLRQPLLDAGYREMQKAMWFGFNWLYGKYDLAVDLKCLAAYTS